MLWEDKLLCLALLMFFYAYSSPVRVAIRSAFEGRQFSWGFPSGVTESGKVAMMSGKGLFGHTDYILLTSFAVIWILCAGMRKPDRFFQVALAGWTSIGFGVGLWLGLDQGDSLTSNKQTLGLAGLSYLWMEVLPAVVAWLLALAVLVRGWVRGDSQPAAAAWTRLNTILLTSAAAFLVLGGVLLNIGPQHGAADFNGVGMTYVSLILFLLGVAPWRERTANGMTASDTKTGSLVR
jgi:hypothetical protein